MRHPGPTPARLVILQNLGIDITPLITALGIGGLAVALALQDTLGNLFAGVQIILSRQVRPRDYVQLSSGEEGWVTDVGARNTTIQTFRTATSCPFRIPLSSTWSRWPLM
ncbi:MAG: mechanosensitive ion channel family protein [Longimicrobiales bacterium]